MGRREPADAQGLGRATLSRFTRFACFDWSGANDARPPGIALAIAGRDGPPNLVDRRWRREDALAWLCDVADRGEPLLVGLDLSPGFPFADAAAFFPEWPDSPPDAHGLWKTVDALSAADPHLGVNGFLSHPEVGRYFRQHGGRRGDRFGPVGRGRLRVCEERQRPVLSPSSCFNLIGAAQVGKSSLTGMRVLHRLGRRIPVWPFDPLPATGPVVVEIYTTLAARAAGVGGGRSKLRDADALSLALAKLGSPPATLGRYDDHSTDAVLTAAWLRANACRPELWSPRDLTPEIARTEGWTFGVA